MNASNLSTSFQREGFIVLRKVLSDDDIQFYKNELAQIANRAHKEKNFTLADGVVQTPAFWRAIINKKITTAVRELLGDNVKFLQHNDLHVGFSSLAWHRDSMNRDYPVGPDWDESKELYQLVRAGVYLQDSTSKFKLGMIPGTHRPAEHFSKKEAKAIHRKVGGISDVLSVLTQRDPLKEHAVWIETNPGDCIIFDPRTIHTGSKFEELKYSFFMAYGVPNSHFYNHYNYYRHLRKDLGYQAFAPELVTLLKENSLYAEERPDAPVAEGAWLPSAAFSFIAKQFK